MTNDTSTTTSAGSRPTSAAVWQAITRPYPVTWPMVGRVALGCAALVALSTLFTKQHYVVDVMAGTLLAFAAYALFLRNYPHAAVPENDRRVAPALALCVGGLVAAAMAIYWVAYQMGLEL